MTLIARDINFEFGTRDGIFEGRGTAVLEKVGGVTATEVLAAFGNELPAKGSQFPNLTGQDLVFNDFHCRWEAGQRGEVARVTMVYGETPLPDFEGETPDEPGYAQTFSSEITKDRSLWWRDASTPEDGDVDLGDRDDIGGTKLDESGHPIDVPRLQMRLVLVETMTQYESKINTYKSMIWHRNSATFQGAPIGKVLYIKTDAADVALGIVRVTHQFIKDEHFHLQQQAKRDENGEVELERVEVESEVSYHAAEVHWIQWFQDKSDLNTLLTNF